MHLLPPSSCCLIVCWLSDDDNSGSGGGGGRSDDKMIDLDKALRQVTRLNNLNPPLSLPKCLRQHFHTLTLPHSYTSILPYATHQQHANNTRQIESWDKVMIALCEGAFQELRAVFFNTVKTAHWQMVKLWEARSDYDRALAAQDVLKKSKLVECQEEELKVVDMTARQVRQTEYTLQQV